MASSSLCALLVLAAFTCHCHAAAAAYKRPRAMGVNYGTLADNLPTAATSVKLLRKARAGAVKIYDANPLILHALAGTGIPVSVMVPNEIIPELADSRAAARKWVDINIKRHPRVRIKYLLVGNELLSYPGMAVSTWGKIVPAMKNLRHALRAIGLGRVKLGTPLAMDALAASYPPSVGAFREDIAGTVMRPLLHFLSNTRSYYFVDAYPYFAWADNQKTISLDYALFQGNASGHYVDPGSGLTYTNLLDQMLDAVNAAMDKLGYGDVKLAISETGWPNAGDSGQAGANVRNAAIYNRNLAQRMAKNVGTPARPKTNMPVFVFSLYNEDLKPGAGTERHWGMFYPNGTSVYQLDLSGRHSYPPLPPPDGQTGNLEWCVLAGGGKPVNETAVQEALNYACQKGTGTCAAIQPGGACYEPNTVDAHANYAFNSYWQQFKSTGGSCTFNGLAEKTNKDPSYGSCKFPSSYMSSPPPSSLPPSPPPPPPPSSLPPPPADGQTGNLEWCVLAAGKPVNETAVQEALNYACQKGTGTCAAIQPGGACYEPNTVDAHASYAFNSYWQQFKSTGGSCSFNGLAKKTDKDPSYGSCKFPSSYPPLPSPPPADGQTGNLEWCMLAAGKPVNETAVQEALNYACQKGTGTCAAIQPGGACYEPNTVDAHASYAFNSYWQQFKSTGGSCSFNGLAEKTNKDPSYGSCKFPSS